VNEQKKISEREGSDKEGNLRYQEGRKTENKNMGKFICLLLLNYLIFEARL
jgi:hypothetical protein